MKWRVNIPSGLYKFMPSASPIASVNHKSLRDSTGIGLMLRRLIDFYCVKYFILCRKKTVWQTQSLPPTCSSQQGREFAGKGIRTATCFWQRRRCCGYFKRHQPQIQLINCIFAVLQKCFHVLCLSGVSTMSFFYFSQFSLYNSLRA